MPSALEFKAFKASANKVKLLCFHPTQPWLVYADKGQDLTVLDWQTQQIVYEAPVGSAEDLKNVEIALQRQAEKDPDYFGPSSLHGGGGTARGTAAGNIRDLCFMDLDTCFWQIAELQSMQHGVHSSTSLPYIGLARRLKGHRWLVAACDTKILMQDLASSAVLEIPRSILDSKAPTCLAILYINGSRLLTDSPDPYDSANSNGKEESLVCPVIAAGTSAGIIFLLSTTSSVCYARLVGGHKAAVTKLLVMGGKDIGSPDILISGAADGTIATWMPSNAPPGGPNKEVSPSASMKAHDAEVTSMALTKPSLAASGSTTIASTYLVSSGEDKRVSILAVPMLSSTLAKWKPLPKGSINGLASCCHTPGTPMLAISGERATVWNLPANGRQLEAHSMLVLDNYLPLGTKKAAKVYTIACHPLQSHIVAVGANAGLGILILNGQNAVPAAIPTCLTQDLTSPHFASSSEQTLEYFLATRTEVVKLAYRAHQNLAGITAVPANRQQVGSHSHAASPEGPAPANKHPDVGPADVSTSPDGRHCSVVWRDVKEYAIYSNLGGENWRLVQSGSGSSVVWASSTNTFAVLIFPQVRLPEARRAKSKKSKAKEEENAQQAAIQAANIAAQSGSHVKIFSISEQGVAADQLTSPVNLEGETAHTTFGGAMLGISTQRNISRGHLRGHKMQFYSWKTGQPIGHELLAPVWLAWDPLVTACALAYPDAIVICRAQPSFMPVITLPIQGAADGLWQHKLLFVATPTEIHAIFVAADKEKSVPFVETVKIASLEGAVISQTASAGDSGAEMPTESMRCPGPVKIAGIQAGMLWLIDASGQPFMIALSHPGLQARIAAAQGNPGSAILIAEAGLAKNYHDGIARFVASMNPGKGVESALCLSGISLLEELKLSRQSSKLRRALRCLQALAAGASSNAAFKELPVWTNHLSETYTLEMPAAMRDVNAFAAIQHLIQHTRGKSEVPVQEPPAKPDPRRSVLAFIAADNADDDTSEDSEAEEQAEALMGLELAPTDAIDWDGPLSIRASQQEAESDQADTKAAHDESQDIDRLARDSEEQAKREVAEAEAPMQEQQRIARLADEGILLIDAALGYGHEDVAKAALRTLLRGVAFLAADHLQAVLVRCAQCSMSSEISSLAARTVADGTGASAETAALVAALVEDSNLAQKTLKSSGMIALSAIFSHTWRSGNSLQEISDWGNFLTAAAGNGIQFAVAPPT